ncbi:STAS domain-containing protein [Streptosporangium sp. NBC_01755]|uniref:STAS domain-containing protein n=1 Tax=Streptosporangium sp. NBC_01755 TaxID=2975949 RepID=UPI002DD80A95|nr:STAS domain-containing protein [Streptosporangium sp. NBC_01755]WSC98378.1 STAS domain-containing protein [Streptosporangium sp. NBC_01755]
MYVIHQYGDTALVAVTGEVDAFNYRLLESELEHLIRTGARHILVDAGELLFCDIRGARALERIHQGLRVAGGELFVVPSPTVARLFNMLWGAQGPEHPGLVTVSHLDQFPEPPSLPLRHAPVLRRVGGGRRARRAATPPVDTLASRPGDGPETRASPCLERAAPRGSGALQAGGRLTCPPAERPVHPALERSSRLRREAAARLETLRLQAQTTCAMLAEIQDRMAILHAELDTHIAVRAAVRLACDDHSRQAKVDRTRDLTTSFSIGAD